MIPPSTRSCHHSWRRISRTQRAEMFQSSCMSWSSHTMAVGTLASSQRITGSPHDSR
jgi:hypothetical protein